jgi:hypothetical protein
LADNDPGFFFFLPSTPSALANAKSNPGKGNSVPYEPNSRAAYLGGGCSPRSTGLLFASDGRWKARKEMRLAS